MPDASTTSTTNGSTNPACKAKLAVSDIRIPLMWKDGADHLGMGKKHGGVGGVGGGGSGAGGDRWAVFCMLTIGTEIYDTVLLKDVDKSLTDICFEDIIVL